MPDDYTISLAAITLDVFAETLKEIDVLPSRRVLKDAIDERITCMKDEGMKTLDDVLRVLKNKRARDAFRERTGLSDEYLTILKREIGSYVTKPVAIEKLETVAREACYAC